MNVGSFQALMGGASQPASTNGAQAVKAANGGGFGAVFNTMVASNAVVSMPGVVTTTEADLGEAITAILNATSVEEVIAILETLDMGDASVAGNTDLTSAEIAQALGLVDETNTDSLIDKLSQSSNLEALLAQLGNMDDNAQRDFAIAFLNLPQLEQLVEELDLDVEKLMEQLMPLLEKAGLPESELEAAKYATDIWALLDVVDKVAPKFFTELTTALEGKGAIPKEDAVQLLALLQSIVVEAPKTDLLEKQEQQVFTLQGFLAVVSEKVETTQPVNQNRQTVAQMLESQQVMRVMPPGQMGQNQMSEDSLKEAPKETIQQPVVAPTQHTTMREEVRLAQPEGNNNARNEALMREMQNIFKRSSFGQTGGTNRLLVKLYPEHLGQVRIELLQQNGVMTARILASSAMGKEMLDSQLHQLRAAFAQQNLQVDRIDVSQTLQDTARNDRDNAFNQHFKKEQEQAEEQQQEQDSEEELTFQEYMIELEA